MKGFAENNNSSGIERPKEYSKKVLTFNMPKRSLDLNKGALDFFLNETTNNINYYAKYYIFCLFLVFNSRSFILNLIAW